MKIKILIAVAAVIIAAGVAGSIFVLNSPKTNTVTVKSCGKTVCTLDLSLEPDRCFDVKCEGGVNTIEIKDGRIRVKSADCPDKTCVNMGWLESSAMPVVCLPHDLIIEFAGDGGEVDAVSK